jgi:hypothetical protein
MIGTVLERVHTNRRRGYDVRTSRRCYANELGEELAAEHAMVFQALIATFELGDIAAGALFAGAPTAPGLVSRHSGRSDQSSITHRVSHVLHR